MKVEHSRLDFDRRLRLGMVEAIWGEHKTTEQIAKILEKFKNASEFALVTRLTTKKAKELIEKFDSAQFHSQARCLTLGTPAAINSKLGEVVVLAAGTSDLSVAAETELALNIHGIKTKLLMDVGVAGLHRLLNQLERIKQAKVVVACAGMEGALPTVLAGLIPQPVIGVPVSVGYGVSIGGRTCLEGMLASCSPGLVVVNIDNGYGAAMAALRIIYSNKDH